MFSKKKGLHFDFISDFSIFLPKSGCSLKKKKRSSLRIVLCTLNKHLQRIETVCAIFEGGPEAGDCLIRLTQYPPLRTWKVSCRLKKKLHLLFTAVCSPNELSVFCVYSKIFSCFTFIVSTLSTKRVPLFFNFAPLLTYCFFAVVKSLF